MQECYKQFNDVFKERSEEFAIDFLKFQKKTPALRDMVSHWNPRQKDEKEKYLETFSIKNWKEMAHAEKNLHSFSNCQGCYHRYTEIQALLPVRSNQFGGYQGKIPSLLPIKRLRLNQAKQEKYKTLQGLSTQKVMPPFRKYAVYPLKRF